VAKEADDLVGAGVAGGVGYRSGDAFGALAHAILEEGHQACNAVRRHAEDPRPHVGSGAGAVEYDVRPHQAAAAAGKLAVSRFEPDA